jgi:hypothetical protein
MQIVTTGKIRDVIKTERAKDTLTSYNAPVTIALELRRLSLLLGFFVQLLVFLRRRSTAFLIFRFGSGFWGHLIFNSSFTLIALLYLCYRAKKCRKFTNNIARGIYL